MYQRSYRRCNDDQSTTTRARYSAVSAWSVTWFRNIHTTRNAFSSPPWTVTRFYRTETSIWSVHLSCVLLIMTAGSARPVSKMVDGPVALASTGPTFIGDHRGRRVFRLPDNDVFNVHSRTYHVIYCIFCVIVVHACKLFSRWNSCRSKQPTPITPKSEYVH